MKSRPRLAEAIHQTKPFDSMATEAMLTLVWANDRIVGLLNAPLASAGLSSAQYNVLRILIGSPDGLQTHQVTERLLTRAPNLTRLVDKLEAKGLLIRRRCSEDRRVVWLAMTDAGRELVQSLEMPVRESSRLAAQGLNEAELRTLIELLTRLRAGADAPTHSPAA